MLEEKIKVILEHEKKNVQLKSLMCCLEWENLKLMTLKKKESYNSRRVRKGNSRTCETHQKIYGL